LVYLSGRWLSPGLSGILLWVGFAKIGLDGYTLVIEIQREGNGRWLQVRERWRDVNVLYS